MGHLEGVPCAWPQVEQVSLPRSGAGTGIILPGQPPGEGGMVSGCGATTDFKGLDWRPQYGLALPRRLCITEWSPALRRDVRGGLDPWVPRHGSFVVAQVSACV